MMKWNGSAEHFTKKYNSDSNMVLSFVFLDPHLNLLTQFAGWSIFLNGFHINRSGPSLDKAGPKVATVAPPYCSHPLVRFLYL